MKLKHNQSFIITIFLIFSSVTLLYAEDDSIPPESGMKKTGIIMTGVGTGLLITGGLSIYATHYLSKNGPYPMTYKETLSESRRQMFSILTGIYSVLGVSIGLVGTPIGIIKLSKYRELSKNYKKSSISFQISPTSIAIQLNL